MNNGEPFQNENEKKKKFLKMLIFESNLHIKIIYI